MEKKLRVAVIGCGAIAQRRHLPEYTARKDVEVVAVVDVKKARARAVAAQFGVPNAFGDYREALALGVDAVSVCSPNAYHAKHTIDSLKVKAHVLCEKPMALSLAEARAMCRAAKAARRNLMIGHNQRFTAGHLRGKELLKSGALGKCLGFDTVFAHSGPESWSVDGLQCFFFRKKEAGMGSMADLGVHKLDLIRWLLDDEIVQVGAMMGTLSKAKCNVEDTAYAIVRMAGGAMGQMFAAWIHPTRCDNSTVLYCQKGILRLEDDPVYTVIAQFANGEEHRIKTQAIQTNEEGGQTASGVIDGFVRSISKRAAPPVPGEEGARSLAAVLACVQSAKTNRIVRVPKI